MKRTIFWALASFFVGALISNYLTVEGGINNLIPQQYSKITCPKNKPLLDGSLPCGFIKLRPPHCDPTRESEFEKQATAYREKKRNEKEKELAIRTNPILKKYRLITHRKLCDNKIEAIEKILSEVAAIPSNKPLTQTAISIYDSTNTTILKAGQVPQVGWCEGQPWPALNPHGFFELSKDSKIGARKYHELMNTIIAIDNRQSETHQKWDINEGYVAQWLYYRALLAPDKSQDQRRYLKQSRQRIKDHRVHYGLPPKLEGILEDISTRIGADKNK